MTTIGLVLPIYSFISFLTQYGFDVQLILGPIVADKIPVFLITNVLITTVVFLIFSCQEKHVANR